MDMGTGIVQDYTGQGVRELYRTAGIQDWYSVTRVLQGYKCSTREQE